MTFIPDALREQAVCTTTDPEAFHDPARIAEAKAVCRRCPVSATCLAWAVETGDRWAVLGGTTPDERAHLIADPRPQMSLTRASARACSDCGRPLVTRPKNGGMRPPEGHSYHAGHGLCSRCHTRRRPNRITARPTRAAYRNLTEQEITEIIGSYQERRAGLEALAGRHRIGKDRGRKLLLAHGVPIRPAHGAGTNGATSA